MFALFSMFAALAVLPASAGEEPPPSEAPAISESVAAYRQLAWEAHQLAKRDAWTGVERVYQQMMDESLPVGPEEHVLGATAARNVGDVSQTLVRLRRAHSMGEDRAVIEWMYRLDTGYGQVVIVDERKKRPTLEPTETFFMPDANRAVQFAGEKLEAGAFDGMLPAGRYTYGKDTFEVVAGERVEHKYLK